MSTSWDSYRHFDSAAVERKIIVCHLSLMPAESPRLFSAVFAYVVTAKRGNAKRVERNGSPTNWL